MKQKYFKFLGLLLSLSCAFSSCERTDGQTYYSFTVENENHGYLTLENGSLIEGTIFESNFENKTGKTEVIKAVPFSGYEFSHWELEKNGLFYKVDSRDLDNPSIFPSINKIELEETYGNASSGAGGSVQTPYNFKACFKKTDYYTVTISAGSGIKRIKGVEKYKVSKNSKIEGIVEALIRPDQTFLGWYTKANPILSDRPISKNPVLDLSTLTIDSDLSLHAICNEEVKKYFTYEIFCENFMDSTDEEKYKNHDRQNKTFLGMFNSQRTNWECFYEQQIISFSPSKLDPQTSVSLTLNRGYLPSNPNYGKQKTDIYGRHYTFIGWIDNIENPETQPIISTAYSFVPSTTTYTSSHRFYAYFDLRK